jgi:hypothetical protein
MMIGFGYLAYELITELSSPTFVEYPSTNPDKTTIWGEFRVNKRRVEKKFYSLQEASEYLQTTVKTDTVSKLTITNCWEKNNSPDLKIDIFQYDRSDIPESIKCVYRSGNDWKQTCQPRANISTQTALEILEISKRGPIAIGAYMNTRFGK